MGIKGKLDQVLEFLPQAEFDGKGQRGLILKALANQTNPKRPVEISNLTGVSQPSVRRVIQVLVREGLVKSSPNNKYSITK